VKLSEIIQKPTRQVSEKSSQGTDRGESAEWLSAIRKGLPMDTPSRMARAKQMGFDTDRVAFHGTNREFTEFLNSMRGSSTNAGSAQRAHWLTSSPETASGYADLSTKRKYHQTLSDWQMAIDQQDFDLADKLIAQAKQLDTAGSMSGQRILPLVKRGNYYVVNADGKTWGELEDGGLSAIIDKAEANGFDGVEFRNLRDDAVKFGSGKPSTHWAIFDPSNIRSVHAAFDPAQSGSAKLLASRDFSQKQLTARRPTSETINKRNKGRQMKLSEIIQESPNSSGSPDQKTYGTIVDFKDYNPENIQVQIQGYARLSLSLLKDQIKDRLQDLINRVDNYPKYVENTLLDKDSVFMSMLIGYNQVLDELNTPKNKRKRTIAMRNMPRTESLIAALKHIKEGVPFTQSLFRYGSDAYFETIQIGRMLNRVGLVENLDWESAELFESDIGEKVHLKGVGEVYLDAPFMNESASAEEIEFWKWHQKIKHVGDMVTYIKGGKRHKSKVTKVSFKTNQPRYQLSNGGFIYHSDLAEAEYRSNDVGCDDDCMRDQGGSGTVAARGTVKKLKGNLWWAKNMSGKIMTFDTENQAEDHALTEDRSDVYEAEYKGKDVELNKPKRGGPKKFYVYTKNPETGKVIRINFGDPERTVKSDDPERAKNFASRHRCEKKNDRTTAGYWSCRLPRYGLVKGGKWW
jgi:hypothetical protein